MLLLLLWATVGPELTAAASPYAGDRDNLVDWLFDDLSFQEGPEWDDLGSADFNYKRPSSGALRTEAEKGRPRVEIIRSGDVRKPTPDMARAFLRRHRLAVPLDEAYLQRIRTARKFHDPFKEDTFVRAYLPTLSKLGARSAFEIFATSASEKTVASGIKGMLIGKLGASERARSGWNFASEMGLSDRADTCTLLLEAAVEGVAQSLRPRLDKLLRERGVAMKTCRAVSSNRGGGAVAELYKFLNGGLGGIASVFPGPSAKSRNELFARGMDRFFRRATLSSVRDMGEFVETEAAESCLRLVQDDFRWCKVQADALCSLATTLASTTGPKSPDELEEVLDRAELKSRAISARNGCRCIGRLYGQSLLRRKNRVRSCVPITAQRLENILDKKGSFTVQYMVRQRVGAPAASLLPSRGELAEDLEEGRLYANLFSWPTAKALAADL